MMCADTSQAHRERDKGRKSRQLLLVVLSYSIFSDWYLQKEIHSKAANVFIRLIINP